MQYVDVTSAQLWFYKEWDENDDELNQTFVLSELDHWDLGGSFEKNTVMAILETDIGGERSIPIPFANPPCYRPYVRHESALRRAEILHREISLLRFAASHFANAFPVARRARSRLRISYG